MRCDDDEYSWRNHMPSLGPLDLAVAGLTGLALSVTLVCTPPAGRQAAEAGAPAASAASASCSARTAGTPDAA